MSTRKRLPIGPLGIAMRRAGSSGRTIAIIALILGLALAAGLALLLVG